MTKRIQNAIDIFLDAINNGTLAAGTCTACAVGNLVAAGIGYEIDKDFNSFVKLKNDTLKVKPNAAWMAAFSSSREAIIGYTKEDGLKNIEATDFTLEEILKIERAFERNTRISYGRYYEFSKKEIRADQIKGLEAIVKVMLTFDEQKENVKEIFTNRAELIEV